MEGQIATPVPADLRVTVLYSVSLRGELRLLPYLFSHIKQQRATVEGITLLVDLGETCRMDWPICRLTEGRALLVAMDGMGYDAFYLSPGEPLLTDEVYQSRLRNTVVGAVLAPGETHTLTKKIAEEQYMQIRIGGGADPLPPAPEVGFTIQLERGQSLASRILEKNTILIEDKREDKIPALGRVDLQIKSGQVELVDMRRLPIPAGIMPDPSISSVIEFVESEVQLAARNKGQFLPPE
jgi:hypothetical protein